MTTINQFCGHLDSEATGRYRLQSKHTDWNEKSSSPCMRLRIADHTGEASVIAPQRLQPTVDTLQERDVIDVTMLPCLLRDKPGGTVRNLERVPIATVTNIGPLLPAPLCPRVARPSLDDLIHLLDRVTQPHLQSFITAALDSCYPAFLQAQAGWKYHHDFPGGLLVHSVAVAQEAERQATVVYPGDRSRVELIVTASLLHDLGKSVQVFKGQNNPVRKLIPHEWQTLTLLDKPLVTLGQNWPEGGRQLTQILVWLGTPEALRPKRSDAEIVHAADVLDVKADRAQGTFAPVQPTAWEVDW